MAAKVYAAPLAVGQAQVRMEGLAKERAHQLRLVPPDGRGDPLNDVVIADREGKASAAIFFYAPGTWKLEVRLDGSDKEPLTSTEAELGG